MLKGIPSIISPELIAALMAMGHGDELVIADGNYPSASMARRLVRADGSGDAADGGIPPPFARQGQELYPLSS